MTSMSQVVKAIVLANIDYNYLAENVLTLEQVYNSEYGYNGVTPKSCMDYLQGLPSVCTIPFSNFEILQLLEAAGFIRHSDDGRCALVDKYWKEAGNQFYHLIK